MPATPRTAEDGSPSDEKKTLVLPRSRAIRAARVCPFCHTPFSSTAQFCPFDGEPLIDGPRWDGAADPLVGKIVDERYEILDVLGEGGMGTVYEARHRTLDRRFAMKVLRRDVAVHEDAVERFMLEAKAAASIGHPNIVAVSDFGVIPAATLEGASDLPYFVMEMLNGESLAQELKRERPLSAKRATLLLWQCAEGLEAAHAAGVIHRDLKPDNIFLASREGNEIVKLVDFGVAKMVGASKLTKKGMVYGTPHYMSPEQASGAPVDHRADVYALGVILYECLSGRVPFEADTFMGVLTQHIFAEPTPLEVVMQKRSGGPLEAITMRCLAKRPEDRFQTMSELVSALRQSIGDPQGALAFASDRPPARLALRAAEQPRPDYPRELPEPSSSGWKNVVALVALAIAVGFVILISVGAPPEEAQPTTKAEEPRADRAPVGAAASARGGAEAGAAPAKAPTPIDGVSIQSLPEANDVPAAKPGPAAGAAPPAAVSAPAPPKSEPPAQSSEIVDPWD